jgi:hypothetical protein
VAVEVTFFEAMVSREATMIALTRLAWPSAREANRENDERACCDCFRSHRHPPLYRDMEQLSRRLPGRARVPMRR